MLALVKGWRRRVTLDDLQYICSTKVGTNFPRCVFTCSSSSTKDKRPDLKQFVLSTHSVDRVVPIWGKPEDGNASARRFPTLPR